MIPVEIKIDSQIGSGDSYVFFTGKVTCENFKSGYLDITESDNSITGMKYIIAQKVEYGGTTIINIHVRAREEYEDESLGPLANELSLSGHLEGAVLKVGWLEISRQETGLSYKFNAEDIDEYLIFKKQP